MAFEMVAGDPASAVILHVPHSSRAVVESGLVVDGFELAEELDHLTDAHTDVIALRAAGAAGRRPWLFVNRLSRLVVDPERFPDETEEMLKAGMGPVYTQGFAGRRLRDDEPGLLEEHFFPYGEAFTSLVDERLAAVGRAVVVDVHSYPTVRLPYELHGDGPRPPICLGTDSVHTPDWLTAAAQRAFAVIGEVRLNTPFAGTYVPRAHWGVNTEVTSLMVEIRRDQYMREPGGEPTAGLAPLARALATLIDAVP
ncbi:N-formylglutamate amidohydrolase [Actinoplanes sp. GCM10030250]|uniref:N-formylglutamate amidohydrolase n=1 Tax=Actinoplanes sp. GCM10030250 TaxID=3273376 RepID=UPI00360879F0